MNKNTFVHFFFSYFSFIVPLATAINNRKLRMTDANKNIETFTQNTYIRNPKM